MQYPGQILEERFLRPLGITAYRLAKSIGVQQTRISEIVRGKRAITADTAVRLGAFFGVPPKWFMDIQTRWDLNEQACSAEHIEQYEGRGRYWVRPTGAQWLGPVPSAKPITYDVDPEFRKQLKARAALGSKKRRRRVVAVEYEHGMKAIVGEDEREAT